MKKYLGKIVVLYFYDHVQDALTPCICKCTGTLFRVAKEYVVIQTWHCFDKDYDVMMQNSNFFTILRKAIFKMQCVNDKSLKTIINKTSDRKQDSV